MQIDAKHDAEQGSRCIALEEICVIFCQNINGLMGLI